MWEHSLGFQECIQIFLFLKQTTYKGLKNTISEYFKKWQSRDELLLFEKGGGLVGLEPSLGQRGAWGYFFCLYSRYAMF